jgi:Tfp pilus assembly protein PilN
MRLTTLNLSSNIIKYVSAGGNGGVKYGSVSPEGLINNGLILQPDIIANQLKTIFADKTVAKERVICSVNGLPFSYRLFTMPKMEPAAFNEAIIREIRKEMPISPDEMYLTWQAYPTEKNEWQVLVAGITRQPVDTLIKTLREAGIPPYYLDLQQLSLARLTTESNAIIVEFEKDYSNIIMLVDGVPQALNIIPSLGPQSAPPEEVRQLTSKLTKMVDFYNGNHPKKPVKDTVKVLLTGELASDPDMAKHIQQELSYPVELLASENKSFVGLPLHEYAANAGSMLMNLAPRTYKKAATIDTPPYRSIYLAGINREKQGVVPGGKTNKMTLLKVAIGITVAALALGFFFQYRAQSDIDNTQAELAEMNTRYTEALNSAKSAQSIQNNIDNINTQLKDIKSNYQLVAGTNDYVADIEAITRSLPAGVIFTSLDINSVQITIKGKTDLSALVVTFARTLEISGGFSLAVINWIDTSSNQAGPGLEFVITITR